MTSTELKCKTIYRILSSLEGYTENALCKEFKNLQSFNISYLAPCGNRAEKNFGVSARILSRVHFSTDTTEFIPDCNHKILGTRAYAKLVDDLHAALAPFMPQSN